jgi:lactoylglutathione lyase
MKIVFLRAGDDVLELIQYVKPKGELVTADIYNPGMAHLCFAVDNIHEMFAKVTAAGYKARSPEPIAIPSGPNKGGYAVYLADPDGFVIEMIQRPPQA